MNIYSWLQLIFFMVVLITLAWPLGAFMARVYEGRHTFLDPLLSPLERFFYKLCGVNPGDEMSWKVYALSMLLFNGIGMLVVYALQRVQGYLPLNPQGLGAVSPDSSWNTAISFATNTNWQGYGGETTMSYMTQMLGMTVQNFVSAATGMAIVIAMIRGLVRHTSKTIGNFWVDLTRSVLYILLPLAFVVALVLVSQGVVQTFSQYKTAALLQPVTDANGNAVTQQSLWRLVRLHHRLLSNNWAPTAAVSSMPTRLTRSRTLLPYPISWKCCPSCSFLRRFVTPSAKWSGTHARAGQSWPS